MYCGEWWLHQGGQDSGGPQTCSRAETSTQGPAPPTRSPFQPHCPQFGAQEGRAGGEPLPGLGLKCSRQGGDHSPCRAQTSQGHRPPRWRRCRRAPLDSPVVPCEHGAHPAEQRCRGCATGQGLCKVCAGAVQRPCKGAKSVQGLCKGSGAMQGCKVHAGLQSPCKGLYTVQGPFRSVGALQGCRDCAGSVQ